MTKFGTIDFKTGDFGIEPTSSLCNLEVLAATFVGVPLMGPPTLAATIAAGSVGAASIAGGTAGLLGAGGVFSVGDLLSGAFSAFSAISDIAAGQAAGVAGEEAALFEEFGAKQEILKGRKEALAILEAEQDALEQNIVSTAAAGLTGQGSPAAAQRAIIGKAAFETGITRTSATISAEARKAKGRQQTIDAAAAVTGGFGAAAGEVAGFFLRRRRRG